MKDRFKELSVETIEIDVEGVDGAWEFLRKNFNRTSIPVNVIYPTDLGRSPVILPEFMGPSDILAALDLAK